MNAKNSLGGYTGDTPFVGLLMDVATKQETTVSIFSVGLIGGQDTTNRAVAVMCADKRIELAGS